MRGQGKTEAQFLWTAVFLALVGVLLAGCLPGEDRREIDLDDRASDAELRELTARTDSDVLWFGFDLRASPQEDARQYLPFLEYLTKATGYTFELRFTPQDGQIVDDLGTGVVQFAALGAGSTIQAHAKYGVIPLVRGLNAQGRAEYRSVIVVAPDSSIQTIADLRGKRFAFGSLTSTQGHLIPRIILLQHGLALDDLAAYAYTGSHRNCANEVTAGRFDAGGMQDTLGRGTGGRRPAAHPQSWGRAGAERRGDAGDGRRRVVTRLEAEGPDGEGRADDRSPIGERDGESANAGAARLAAQASEPGTTG